MSIFYVDFSDTESTYWDQITEIGGREYIFRVRWNARALGWYMDVNDQDDVPIVNGVRLVCNVPLAREVIGDPRMWTGTMMCLSTTSDDSDPGLTDLGQRVVVVYDDTPSVAALAAAGILGVPTT